MPADIRFGCACAGEPTPLVRRSGRHGSFWGCPRYPSCDTTVDAARGRFRGRAVVQLGHGGSWVPCGSPEHWAYTADVLRARHDIRQADQNDVDRLIRHQPEYAEDVLDNPHNGLGHGGIVYFRTPAELEHALFGDVDGDHHFGDGPEDTTP